MTANRIANSLQMLTVVGSMGDSKDILDRADAFVGTQKSRAEGLLGQAYATQGTYSSLGRQLQNAINDLNSYRAMGSEVSDDLDERMSVLGAIIQQFDLPRGARSLNMSGKEMTDFVTGSAVEVRQNLEAVKNVHYSKVTAAIGTIDDADQCLNGRASTRARDSFPQLD